MKSFYLQCVAVFLSSVAIATGVVYLSGCNSQQSIAAHLAVSYATAKYIEQGGADSAGRAARVLAVADAVQKAASGESVTVDALRLLVIEHLPPTLSPADKVLAGALIDAAVAELQARIGAGVLKPDSVLKVREVLGWVREGASQFVPGG